MDPDLILLMEAMQADFDRLYAELGGEEEKPRDSLGEMTPGDAIYEAVMQCIVVLGDSKPLKGSPAHQVLLRLLDAAEQYQNDTFIPPGNTR